MTRTYTAVVDRIVDGETAVVLLEAGDETVGQLDVDVQALPADGRHEGAVLELSIADGEPCDLRSHPRGEDERRERLQERFDRLSKRLDDE